MAWTQTDIDDLKSKIKGGLSAESTQYEGRRHDETFRTLNDQMQLLEIMEREVNGTERDRTSYAIHSKE